MPKRLSLSFVWQPTETQEQPPKKRRKDTPTQYKHTREEWLSHRERIEELFEDNELPTVAEIMAQEQGFHATVPQYQHKLKEWGASWKYLKLSAHQKSKLKEEAVQRAMDFKPRMSVRLKGKKIPSKRVSRVLKDVFQDSTYGSVGHLVESHMANLDLNKATEEFDSAFLPHLGYGAERSEGRSDDSDSILWSDSPSNPTRAGSSDASTPGSEALDKVPECLDYTQHPLLGRVVNGTRTGSINRASVHEQAQDLPPSVKSTWNSNRYTTTDSHELSVYSSSSRGASIPSFIGMPSLTRRIASMLRNLPLEEPESKRNSKVEPHREGEDSSSAGQPPWDPAAVAKLIEKSSHAGSIAHETIRMYEEELLRIDQYNGPFIVLCTQLNLNIYDGTFWASWQDVLPDIVFKARNPGSQISLDNGMTKVQFRVDLLHLRRAALTEIERLYQAEWDQQYLKVHRPSLRQSLDDERSLQLVIFEKELMNSERGTVSTAVLVGRSWSENAAISYQCRFRSVISFPSQSTGKPRRSSLAVKCADLDCELPLFHLDEIPLEIDAASSPVIKKITFYSVNAIDERRRTLSVTPLIGQIPPTKKMFPEMTPFRDCKCTRNIAPAAYSFCRKTTMAASMAGNTPGSPLPAGIDPGTNPREALASLIFENQDAFVLNSQLTWRSMASQRDSFSGGAAVDRASRPSSALQGDGAMLSVDDVVKEEYLID